MSDLFKDKFNPTLIETLGLHFHDEWQDFDHANFVAYATNNLANLALKERSYQITTAMRQFLPDDFVVTAKILLASLRSYTSEDSFPGWAIMPMADYVGLYGQGHHEISMHLLKVMTQCFSSEFGIRYFLLSENKAQTLATLKQWATDESYHVRRLVSEGTRPRLPWAMQLPAFIADPTPVIALLNELKDDKEEYVRRSVANNLNDIAKDHPNLVAETASEWMQNADKQRKKLVRHACRTLLKQSHPKVLQLFGYHHPKLDNPELKLTTPTVYLHGHLEFNLRFTSNSPNSQSLMIDYIIHYQKKNGLTAPKVFKGKTVVIKPGETLNMTKRHPFKKITTRTYYPGRHAIEVIINGISIALTDFLFFNQT